MLKYVVEEVDRVKGLFEKKEQRLIEERDNAQKEAAACVAAARSEAASDSARATELEARLGTYPQQLEVLVPFASATCYGNTCNIKCPPRRVMKMQLQDMAEVLLEAVFSITCRFAGRQQGMIWCLKHTCMHSS